MRHETPRRRVKLEAGSFVFSVSHSNACYESDCPWDASLFLTSDIRLAHAQHRPCILWASTRSFRRARLCAPHLNGPDLLTAHLSPHPLVALFCATGHLPRRGDISAGASAWDSGRPGQPVEHGGQALRPGPASTRTGTGGLDTWRRSGGAGAGISLLCGEPV